MRTSIILILTLCSTSSLISAQLPNYFQSNNNAFPNFPQYNSGSSGFQQNPGFSGYQQNSGYSGFRQNPGFSGFQQNSGFSGFQSQPSTSFPQYQPYNNRIQSVPQQSGGYPSFPQVQSSGFASYPQSPAPVAQPQPTIPGPPQSWSISHGVSQPQRQFQSSPTPSYQPQPQSFSPPSAPQSYGSSAIPQPFSSALPQSWNTQSFSQYRPQPQFSPPSAPQSYSPPSIPSPPQYQPQPAPQYQSQPPPQYQPQPAPQPAPQQYTSPQNSQNFNPAPVHYASIGEKLQGDYKFGYHTGDGGSFREETRNPDGSVQGAYGFIDADGKQRIVKYTAGKDGFKAEGDDVPRAAPVNAPTASAAPAPQQYAPQQYAPQQYAVNPQSNSLGGDFNLGDSPAFKSFMSG